MRLPELHTDDAVLEEIGRRLARHRLERNLTQAELAERAGVGRATLQRLEAGASPQSVSLIKVMRVLGLLDALDSALPEEFVSPIAQLDRARSRQRQRVRHGSEAAASDEEPWTWGDE